MSYRHRAIARVLGALLGATGCAMLLPALCALLCGDEGDLVPILTAAAISAGLGFPLWWLFRRETALLLRDAIAIAVFGWVLVSAVSALPFVIHGAIPSFTDAFFEMMSGYTTTGATALQDIDALPRGLLLWRSETQLLGGIAFLILTVFFLPHSLGGFRVFRTEASSGRVITQGAFTPGSRDAMLYIAGIYLGLNAVEIILLSAGGVSLFDAICLAFGTVSTAGYAPRDASVGHYDSAYVDGIISLFMVLGGTTFLLFYHSVRGEWRIVRRNTELRWYLGLLLFFCVAVTWILYREGTYGFLGALRHGSFQAISLLTTTGFTTADYEQWPHAAQMFLYTVCFIGACAGSTTSGIKIVHYVIIWKLMVGAVKKIFLQPLAVVSVRINGRPLDQSVVDLAICYFIVNIVMVLLGGWVMVLLDDMDYVTGMSAVVSSLMNIGPGFGDVGPAESYAHVSSAGKWFLAYNMLVGRLEMFTVLVFFYPAFWKR